MIKNICRKGLAALLCAGMVLGLMPNSSPMEVKAASTISTYEPITINAKSLNGSTVWGKGDSAFTMDKDGGFFSSDKQSDGALPDNGQITTSDGIPYQLTWSGTDYYSGNDSIRIVGQTNGSVLTSTQHTMTLLSYGAYSHIYVLGTAGGFEKNTSSLNFSVTLTYTDGTKSTTTYALWDWYKNVGELSGNGYKVFKRLNSNGTNIDPDYGHNGGPIMQSKAIECDNSKLLKSITFQIAQTDASVANKNGIYAAIYAVTGEIPQNVPKAPIANLPVYDNTTDGKINLNATWNSVSGAESYRVDVSEYPAFYDADRNPSFVNGYNNIQVMGNSCKITGLDKNKTYYYRVRAVNSSGQSASSNVVMINLPQWALDAGITMDDATYDQETGKLILKKDVVLDKTMVIPTNSDATIDLNGKKLSAPLDSAAISASGEDVKLTITDNSSNGGGQVVGGNGSVGHDGKPAIDLSGTSGNSKLTVKENTSVIGGNGGNAGESGNGGNGADAIVGKSSTSITINGGTSGSPKISGGNGGNGGQSGNGGQGGSGISSCDVSVVSGEITGGNGGNGGENGDGGAGGNGVTQGKLVKMKDGNVTGGNGGNATSGTGNGGAGGTGVAGTIGTSNGINVENCTITGGNGGIGSGNGAGGNGGNGVSDSAVNANAGDNSITGGNGGNGGTSGAGGNGGNGVSGGSVEAKNNTDNNTISGGVGGDGHGTGAGGDGGAGVSGSNITSNGTAIKGGAGGDAEDGEGGAGGNGVENLTGNSTVTNGTAAGGNGGQSENNASGAAGAGASGSGSSKVPNTSSGIAGHVHTYNKNSWMTDDTYHWHACTFKDCTNIANKAEHTKSQWIVDTPATKWEKGKRHKECTVCKKVLETGIIDELKKDDSDYLTEAKDSVQKTLQNYAPSNDTNENNIIEKVKEATGFPSDAEIKITDFANVPATKDTTGKITGTITIKYGEKEVSVSLNKVIPKIEKSSDEKKAEIEETLKNRMNSVLVNNGSDPENIKKQFEKILAEEGVSTDVSVVSAGALTLNPEATTETDGKMTGTITVSVGGEEVSIPFERVIPKLPANEAEQVAGAKNIIDEQLALGNPNMAGKSEDEIIAEMKEMLTNAGYPNVEPTVEDVFRVDPTETEDGTYSGNFVFKSGDQEIVLPFSQVLPATGKSDADKITEVKKNVENALTNDSLKLSNQTTVEDFVNEIRKELANAGYTDVDFDMSGLTKKNASSIADGNIRGNLVIKVGNQTMTISVDKTIPKLASTDTEKVAQVESELHKKLPTLVADKISSMDPSGDGTATVKDVIRESLQEMLLNEGYTKEEATKIVNDAFDAETGSVKNLEITAPTTSAAGKIKGTLELKLDNKKLGSIELDETIPKLESGETKPANPSQKVLDAANMVQDKFDQISISSNDGRDMEEIKSSVEAQVKEMLKNAGYPDNEENAVIPSFTWTKEIAATKSSTGILEGSITFKCGDKGAEQTITVSKVIPKLSQTEAEKTEEEKQIETVLGNLTLSDLSAGNSENTNAEKIKEEFVKALKEQLKNGYSDSDIEKATIDADSLDIIPPTSGSMGSVKGNITIKIGDNELSVSVDKNLNKLPKTDAEIVSETKDAVKERISYISVSNDDTDGTSVINQIKADLEKLGIQDADVTMEDYKVVSATEESKGLVSGTIVIKKNNETVSYPFEKVIPKLPKNAEEALETIKTETVKKLNDELNNEMLASSASNDELAENVKKILQASNQNVTDVTVKDFKRTEPADGKPGRMEGTLTVTMKDGSTFDIPYESEIPYAMSEEEKKEKTEQIIKSEINKTELRNATSASNILTEMEKLLKENGITDANLTMEDFRKTNATTTEDGKITGTVKVVLPDGTILSIPFDETIPKIEKTDKQKVNDAIEKIKDIADTKDFQPVNSTTKETLLKTVESLLKEAGLSDVKASIDDAKFTIEPATTDTEGTLTATIKIVSGNTSATKKLTLKIPKIEQTSNGNSGTFTVEGTEKKLTAPKTEIKSTIEEVKDAVPGISENQEVKVYLQIEATEKTPENRERQKIEKKAAEEEVEVGQFVDISMIRKVTTTEGGVTETVERQITELNKKIMLQITIPESLRAANRTYTLLHYHDGEVEAEVVEGTYDPATYTFTFYTDKFSTYAIAYTEKTPSSNNSDETTEENKKQLDSASAAIKDTLAKLPATSVSSKEDLEAAIKSALSNAGTKDVTCEITEFNKVDPTKKTEGKVSGKIVLTVNGMSTVIPFSYTLAKVTDSKDNVASAKMPLLVTAKSGNKTVKLSWKKVTGATGYEVYTSVCDGGKSFKKTETKKLTSTIKNLSNKKSYKFYVRAYKVVNGKKVYLNKSPQIHVAMKDYKKTNVKTIKNVKASYKLTVGKKAGIRATTVKENKNKKLLAHAAEFRYYSSDTSVATVNQKGVITAKKTGKCTVYVVANNGVYKTINVTVGE